MSAARWRLMILAVLFATWIAYLGNLALANRNAVILSHAQFLASTLDVVADVEVDPGQWDTARDRAIPRPQVHVRQVIFPEAERSTREGSDLVIDNLRDCKGWTGTPGPYILPLVVEGEHYRVASVPPSPGFEGNLTRIYPARPDTLAQLPLIPKSAAAGH